MKRKQYLLNGYKTKQFKIIQNNSYNIIKRDVCDHLFRYRSSRSLCLDL